jgi:hypothetical protein
MREKGAELASSVAEKAAKVAEAAKDVTKVASGLPGISRPKSPSKKDLAPEQIAWDNDEYRALPAEQRLVQLDFTAKAKLDEKHTATIRRMHTCMDEKRLKDLQKRRRLAYLKKNEGSVVLCQSMGRRKVARAQVQKEKKKRREEEKHKRYVASKAAQSVIPLAYEAWAVAHKASAAATSMNEKMARLAAEAAATAFRAWDDAVKARIQSKMQTKCSEYNVEMEWGSDASTSNWVCVSQDTQIEFNDSFHVRSLGLQPPNGTIATPLADCFGTCTKLDWETHFFVPDPENPKQRLTYDKLEAAERPDTAIIRNLPLSWFGIHHPPTNAVNLDTAEMNPIRSAFAAFGAITGFDTEMVAGGGVFGLIEEKRKRDEQQKLKAKEEREEQKRLVEQRILREQVRSRQSSRGSSRGSSRPGSRASMTGSAMKSGGKAKAKGTGKAKGKGVAKSKSSKASIKSNMVTKSMRGSRGKKVKGRKLGPKLTAEELAQQAAEEGEGAKADRSDESKDRSMTAVTAGEDAKELERPRTVQFDDVQTDSSVMEASSSIAPSPTPDDLMSMGVLSLFEDKADGQDSIEARSNSPPVANSTIDGEAVDGEAVDGEFTLGGYDDGETAEELAERVAVAVSWAAAAAVAAAAVATEARTAAAAAAAENMGAGGPFGIGNRGALKGALLCDVYVQFEKYEDFMRCMKIFCSKVIKGGTHRGSGATGGHEEVDSAHEHGGIKEPRWYPEATLDTDRYFLGKRVLGRKKRRKDLLDMKRLEDRKVRVKELRKLKVERKQYNDLMIALTFIDEAFKEMRGRPMVNANGVPVNPATQAYGLFYRLLDEGEKLAVEAREHDRVSGIEGVSVLKKEVTALQRMRRAADTLFKEECAQVLPSILWVMHLMKCHKFGQLLEYTYGIDADGIGAYDPHEGQHQAIAAAREEDDSVVDGGTNKHVDYTRSIRLAKEPKHTSSRARMGTTARATAGPHDTTGTAGASGNFSTFKSTRGGTAGVGGEGGEGSASMMMSQSMPMATMHPTYGVGDNYTSSAVRAVRSARAARKGAGLSSLHGCTVLVPVDKAFLDSGVSTFEPRCWGAHVIDGPYKIEDFYMLDAGRMDTVGHMCQLSCAVNGGGKYVIWVRSEK